MKATLGITTCAVTCCLILTNAAAIEPDLARFVGSKQTQMRDLAGTNKIPAIVQSYFDSIRVDDWETATNLARQIFRASGLYSTSNKEYVLPALQTPMWPPIAESISAYEQFHIWDNKLLRRFGSNIISSIPAGSVFFGGTDPGRFIISALSDSHREGRPFFTITQNQLVDVNYIEYLRSMYGRSLYIPTTNETATAFQEYMEDVSTRYAATKLRPGEDVQVVQGQIHVSGQIAVMDINGRIAKVILDKNLERNFYIEESLQLDWMYPYLSPHGLIMELHHKPLGSLDQAVLTRDRDYWKGITAELIGDWITEKTSVKEICDFAEKTYLRTNFSGFNGNIEFARNDQAQKCFSKLRSSIGGLYAWRAGQAKEEPNQRQMLDAAAISFRQAFALCPYSPDVVLRYVQYLVNIRRIDDAIQVTETALRIDPDDTAFKELLKGLRKTN
jgi:tetratricopeptide (TPR) repeat protein